MTDTAAEVAITPETALARVSDILRLRADGATLSWHTDGARIRENAAKLDALRPFDKPRERAFQVDGFFRGFEEFCAVWVLGRVEPLPFVWAAADFIVEQVVQEFTTPEVHNCFGFAHLFGADAVGALLNVLSGSLPSIKEQYRRLEIIDEDDDGRETGRRHAPIGTDDGDFDEAYMVKCGPDDEHAGLITFMDLDEDAYAELSDLIEKKSDAARRAYQAAAARDG